MAGFLLIGAVLAYPSIAVAIAKAGDAAMRWWAKRDKWGM